MPAAGEATHVRRLATLIMARFRGKSRPVVVTVATYGSRRSGESVIRRDAFEAVGGFDERYFMFAEDMDLCWRVRARGFGVAAVEGAVVTHVEGVSRRGVSRAMVIAHHASALRFEAQTSRGWRRALLPVAALVLGLRLSVLTLRAGRGGGVD